MKNFTKALGLVILSFALLFPNLSKASHFKGGDIYFQCVGNGVYKLVFTCYYSCEPFGSTPYPPSSIQWTLSSTCGGVPTTLTASTAASSPVAVDVPLYCRNILTSCDYNYSSGQTPPGTPDGTLLWQYVSDTFSIPPGCTVTAEMTQGNRNAAITNLQNPSSTYIDIVASVTTPAGGGCENNPVFASFPVNIFCVGENANFSQGAFNLSGDSLVYTLINPRDIGGNPIPFVAGCTPSNPMGAPGTFASVFNFNSATGNVNFTPTQSGNYVMAVEVDAYHNGVLVSTTMRDIQIVVINCVTQDNSPHLINFFDSLHVVGGLVYDSTHIGVCPGSQLQITLNATDPDSFNFVKDSADFALLLPGSSISTTHTGGKYDTSSLHIFWTPQNSDSGFHYVYLTISDTFCPRPGTHTYAFVISVLTGLYAGPNQVYCNGGQPVTIQAHGAVHYVWTDSATGGPPIGVVGYSADSSAIIVAPPTPNVSVGYVVHGDLLGSCKNYDTVSVKNVPRFSLSSQAQDPSICKYTSTTVSTTATPANVGPYTYVWGPAGQVVSPSTASTAITPLLTDTWFKVTVTAIGGCVITDSVQVRISGAAPRISIVPSDNNVCPGDTVTLTGFAFAENLVICGLVDTCPDNNILSSQAVGTDNSNTTAVETPYPGFYPSARTQYLITAAEMNAAGLSSGAITDISFFVTQINSTLGYDSFTVSMGCTTLDSLTGFVNNLQEVAPAFQFFPNLGWSPHPFTHFYNWDGYSNLVIQVCYTRTSTNFDNDDYVAYTTTPYFGSTIYDRDFGSGANGCSLNSFPTVSNNRPNIKIGMCSPNVLTYQWTPATLLCDTCAVTQVIVSTDSTYTLTVHDANCVNDSAFRVTINRNIAINAVPDTTLCNNDTVQLNVILTNPAPALCLQNYSVTSIPYATIPGAAITVPGTDYLDASGFNSQDDATAGPYNIGFTFPFYCQTFSQFWVNSNGWISFVDPYPATMAFQERTAQTFPPSGTDLNPQKMIVLMMGDYYLAPGGSGNIKYFVTGTAPNRILVVQYNAMEEFFTPGVTTTGEMHLYENSGVIDILIQSSNYAFDDHTTGIKDSTGLGIAAPGRNNTPYTISTPEAWRFTPQNGPSVVLNQTIWSPNVSLSNDSIVNPNAYPSTPQTYYVDEYLTINQFTHPTTCHVRDSVRINVATFTHNVTASPLTVCPGDTTQLTFNSANAVNSYSWMPTSLVIDPTAASPHAVVYDTTEFFVTAVDVNGCHGLDSVTVNIFPTQRPHVDPDITICYSDSIQLTVSGTYNTYQWISIDPVTGVRTPFSSSTSPFVHGPGEFIVRVVAAGATCPYFSDTAYIDTFARQPLFVVGGPDSFCTGGNVVLQVTQGLNNYQWTPTGGSNQAVPVTASGDYSYTAQDANGCLLFSDTARVRVSDPPQIIHSPIKDPICDNETETITVSTVPPGVPVIWQQGGTQVATGNTYTITTPGTYDIIASIGCPTDSTFTITGAPAPVVSLDSTGPISSCGCGNQVPVTATATPASAADVFTWSADSSHGATYNIDSTGTYTVTVTDGNNCTASTSISATLTCPQIITTVLKDSIYATDSTQILTVSPAGNSVLTSYQWTPAGYVLSPTDSSTGALAQHLGIDSFYVTVTDNNGCTNTKLVTFAVIEQGDFKMATAFTPNGDGKNDNFYPILNPSSRVTAFRIYNRWGQLVYDSPNAPGWNGNYGGTPQATDTYVYFVTVESPDPKDATKKVQKSVEGSFQLFR